MAIRTEGRRARRARLAAPVSVPFVPWSRLINHIGNTWRTGQHVTLIGKTNSGKTHLALELADLRPYVVIAATKRRDSLMSDAQAHGYRIVPSMREVPYTETGHPVFNRVIVWPATDSPSERNRQAIQAAVLRETLSIAERQSKGYSGWTVLIDETMWAYDMLGLKRELDAVWYQGRSAGMSLIACAQRPTRVPRLMISQASHLFLWMVSDKRDLEPLREIAGAVPPQVIEDVLPTLDFERHEFLYVGVDTGYVARSIAPPR